MKKLAWALVPMIVVAVSVSGCSTKLARPIGLATIAPASEIDGVAVIIDGPVCTRGARANLMKGPASVLTGTAVDFAVNAAGEWIESRKLRRNAIWSASGVAKDCSDAPWQSSSVRSMAIRRAVFDHRGRFKDPAFELTGKVAFDRFSAGDGKEDILQVTWQDTSLTYGRTAAPDRGSKRKHVVVLLGFTPSAVLTTADTATGQENLPGVIRLDLGYIRDGYDYPESMLRHVEGVSTIAVPANDTLNVTAIVVETEDESLALKALSDAFDSNKSGLAEALKESIGVSK